ncbi:hypothetical protein BIWAKO_04640 [Bosea sp. BIWAKO-01]|nr:hypothetical protein BIWAKO_04640 [Bosea sp. BIWAKO-01]
MLRLPSWRAAFEQNSDDPVFVDICEAYELVWSVLDFLITSGRPEATDRIEEYRELAASLESDALMIAKDCGWS